jgi:hypothetical protein
MKKKYFAFALLALSMISGISAKAQSGDLKRSRLKQSSAYLRLGAGYGFILAGRTELAGEVISGEERTTQSTYDLKMKRASYGSGLYANLAGGYMFNPHVGVELGVQVVIAPTKYTFTGLLPNFNNRIYTSVTHAKNPVYIIPALVLSTGNKLKVYSRTGIVLPVMDKVVREQTNSGSGTGWTTEIFTSELRHRFTIGMQGAAGVSYSLGSRLSVWMEGSFISRNAYAKEQELIGYTENGINMMGSVPQNSRIVEYEYEVRYTTPSNATGPEKLPVFSTPFSSIGLGAGIRYSL